MINFPKVSYDRDSDVLYIATRTPQAAKIRESLPGVLWRYDTRNGKIVGVTVMDFAHYWVPRMSPLVEDIGKRLHMKRSDVRSALKNVHH